MQTRACSISIAQWPTDIERARVLLTNYGLYLARSPIAATGFCRSGYEEEIRGLPGKYATAEADLLLATVDGADAGCAAITRRALADGTAAAELKRLWVEPAFRGCGLGRGLIMHAIDWTRRQGASAVVLDTVLEAMPEAAALYRSLGFEEIQRFNDNPVSGVRFYKLSLR